jgi:hypothetical protein
MFMNEIEGMLEDFKKARVVYLTTFSDGEERSRQMTNLNDDPYKVMWFPTYNDVSELEGGRVLRDRRKGGIRVRGGHRSEMAVVVPLLAPRTEEALLVPRRSPLP